MIMFNFFIQFFIEEYLELNILTLIGLFNIQFDNGYQIGTTIANIIVFVNLSLTN